MVMGHRQVVQKLIEVQPIIEDKALMALHSVQDNGEMQMASQHSSEQTTNNIIEHNNFVVSVDTSLPYFSSMHFFP